MIDDNRASYYVTMLHWPVVFVVITSSIDHPGRLTRQWELDVRYTMPSLSPSVIIGQQATIVVSVFFKKKNTINPGATVSEDHASWRLWTFDSVFDHDSPFIKHHFWSFHLRIIPGLPGWPPKQPMWLGNHQGTMGWMFTWMASEYGCFHWFLILPSGKLT